VSLEAEPFAVEACQTALCQIRPVTKGGFEASAVGLSQHSSARLKKKPAEYAAALIPIRDLFYSLNARFQD
jgi:Na+/citrate or Na+/malate symporter